MTEPRPDVLPEARVVALVRAMEKGDLRTLLDELDGLLGQPACPEAQGDGVPCPTAGSACDQCRRARPLIASVRRRLGLC